MKTTMVDLKGSGNSLVYDEIPSYEDFQRCKHCCDPLSFDDVFYGSTEDVCNNCLSQEKLQWYCNDCEHDWEGLGIPMKCIACNSYNLESPLLTALNERRYTLLKLHLKEKP